MADLLTTSTLARWTQSDPAEVASDEFAKDLIRKVSQLACFIGGHDGTKIDSLGDPIPEWTASGPDAAPIDVQMVVLQVCKRSYENPGQVIQESTGPLSERVSDVQALFMDFTDSERATLARYNPDGDPAGAADGQGVLFTISTSPGRVVRAQTSPLYVSDNQQIGLSGSPDPRPWNIPLFNPGDPGDDANYDEE